jgi:hypothetical protein
MAIEIALQAGDVDTAIERSKWTTGELPPEGEYNMQITEFKPKKITKQGPNLDKDAIQLRGKLISSDPKINGVPVQKHINCFYGAHYDAVALSVALNKVKPGDMKVILPSEREAIGKVVGIILEHEADSRPGKVNKDGTPIMRLSVKTFKPRFQNEGEPAATETGSTPKTKVNF